MPPATPATPATMPAPTPAARAHRTNQFDLLRQRRFAPFFWTQFLGAANDNVFKNALVIFVAFHAASITSLDPNTLVNLAGAVFIFPFMLLSATGGQLADKFEKSRVIRAIKLFEIAIMAVGFAGFWLHDLAILFTALALMGVHSTLFGPVKYAILPQKLKPEELVGGNGLVEMGTFVAILLGTIAGGLVVGIETRGPLYAGALAVAIALAGWWTSRAIPVTPAVDPELKFGWNPFAETWRNLRFASRNRVVWLSMMGISWFWFYGAVFLAQFAGFSRDHLGGNETVVTALLALFSVGIGAGSLLCEKMSRHRVELGLVPFGSIGLTLFAIDLWFASRGLRAGAIAGMGAFLAHPPHWRVAFDLVAIGVFGGFYIVPLYALIQERSAPTHRSRIIAANNILNALFIVAAALLAIAFLKAGLSIPDLFLVTGLMNAAVSLFIFRLVPEFLMRFLAWILINLVYHVRATGLENIPEDGPCVVACNHVSYVDAVAVAGCVVRPVRFVMDHRIFAIPVLSFVFRNMGAIPIAPAKEDPAMKERGFADSAAVLARGEVLGIFPEGQLTPDGEIGAFRPGLNEILQRTPAPVVPMALRGLWGSYWSRAKDAKSKRFRLFSRIALVVGEPIDASEATPERLREAIAALRGSAR